MPYLPLVPLLLGLSAPLDASWLVATRTDAKPSAVTTLAATAGPRIAALTPRPLLAPASDPAASDETTRSATARAHYTERRYLDAARMYEQLWRDTQAPKYRFNAGMARSAAEHDGAAIVHWQAYLTTAPSVSPRERSMLVSEIAAAKQRTRPLKLKIQGPLAPATLTLTAPEGAPQGPRDPIELIPATAIDLSLEPGLWIATLERPGRPRVSVTFAAEAGAVINLGGDPHPVLDPPTPDPATDPVPITPPTPATLTLTLGPRRALAHGITVRLQGPSPIEPSKLQTPEQTWQLPPGAWKLHAEARDHDPRSADLQLAPGDLQRLDLQLRPDRSARARLGLGLGLGATGFVLFSTGAVVVAGNSNRDLDCSTRVACQNAADRVLDRSIGFSLLGAGLGAAIPALTAGLGRGGPPSTPSDRALLAEAGLGGVLLVGGLSWYLSEVTQTTALDHIPRQHAAAMVRGLGGGLLGGAVVSLVVRRLTRGTPPPVTMAPTFSPYSRGFALQAHF